MPADDDLYHAARACLEAAGHGNAAELHGPMPAPMPRRAGYQRLQLLLSARERRPLHAMLDTAVLLLHDLPEARKVRWSLDVDPIDLY